jgi:hypothetical protein
VPAKPRRRAPAAIPLGEYLARHEKRRR